MSIANALETVKQRLTAMEARLLRYIGEEK
jgi:hypothetical protein